MKKMCASSLLSNRKVYPDKKMNGVSTHLLSLLSTSSDDSRE